MRGPLRLLLLEDDELDAALLLAQLRSSGYEPTVTRVEDEDGFRARLDEPFDVIVADYHQPRFDAEHALAIVKERGIDTPFIVVSGVVSEEAAVAMMLAGADDYLMKDRVTRLGPAIANARERRALAAEARAAESALAESEWRFRTMLAEIDLLAVMFDRDWRITFANGAFRDALGLSEEDLQGSVRFVDLLDAEDLQLANVAHAAATAGGHAPRTFVSHLRGPGGDPRTVRWTSTVLRDTSGRYVATAAIGEDVTARRQLELERARLTEVVEHATETIVITDTSGTILYVNPSFERTTGYTRDEAMGKNPRILKSGRQSAAFYEAMWRRLSSGKSWSGEFVNRRRDGRLYHEMASISPILDDVGVTRSYVAVKRDITYEREIEAQLEQHLFHYSRLSAALARIGPGESLEQMADAVCAEMIAIPGVDLAMVSACDHGVVTPLAFEGPSTVPVQLGRPSSREHSAYLSEHAARGPWVEPIVARPGSRRADARMAELGIRAVARAPISEGSEVVGLLTIGTANEADARTFGGRLPFLVAFAAAISAIQAPVSKRMAAEEAERRLIRLVLRDREFTPVFQPIVDLARGEIVGWEALTRFTDGTRPDARFIRAHAVGLGTQLEVACCRAAIESADDLPPGGWLSLNASPAVVLSGPTFTAALGGSRRPLVIEVTEQAPIDDYAAFRDALASTGEDIRLSIDDGGAGYSSLRHVLELHPHFVKLDRSMVAGIDRDSARQALVSGMVFFQSRSGFSLIAEGVETEAERDTLRRLEVGLGQGYLLGRPQPAEAWASTLLRAAG